MVRGENGEVGQRRLHEYILQVYIKEPLGLLVNVTQSLNVHCTCVVCACSYCALGLCLTLPLLRIFFMINFSCGHMVVDVHVVSLFHVSVV